MKVRHKPGETDPIRPKEDPVRIPRALLVVTVLCLPVAPALGATKGCGTPSGVSVVTPKGVTSSLATPGQPVAGSANGADTSAQFLLDLSSVKQAKQAPVRVTVSWGSSTSNFDTVVADRFGFEYGRGTAVNTASEVIELPALASCEEFVVTAKNTAGSPNEALSVKIAVGDVQVAAPAKVAALPRAGWVPTGSPGTSTPPEAGGTEPPSNVFDGSLATRWSTGAPQNPSGFLQVDLAKPTTFSRLVAQTGPAYVADAPIEYNVQVSDDQVSWRIIAAGVGGASTEARFPQQTVRYVKVAMTGTTWPNWWSVSEVNLFKDACFSRKTGC
jgi:hypothetical protein